MKPPVLFVAILLWSLKTIAQPWNAYHPEPFPANPVAGGWTALQKCDDCYEQVQLPFTYTMYGSSFNSVYINTNGVLSFGFGISTWAGTPFPMNPANGHILAPFWTDVDTRGTIAGNTTANQVWYKRYPDRLVVIWNRVGYFNSMVDSLSTFEAVLLDNSVPLHRYLSDLDVRLTCDTLRWVTGIATPLAFPVTGWDAGNGVNFYNLPGSGTPNLTGYPGPFSRAFQFDNIREAQTRNPLPGMPAIRYPDTLYYRAGMAVTPATPANTGGAVPATIYGSVSTYAGSSAGYTDSVTPLNARFNKPAGLAVDRLGNVYVGDCGNSRIRMIPVSGNVTTHSATIYDTAAKGLATNLVGSVYRAYGKGGRAMGGAINFNYGIITGYTYNNPTGIAVDSTGNVYVADRNTNKIWFSTASGNATTITLGLMNPVYTGSGTAGMANGAAATATFNQPAGVALDTSGNLYVADLGNNQIRKITKAGIVSLFAGDAAGVAGLANGTGTAARFNKPFALTVDRIGNVYVGDSGNHVIRKITPTGVVTTLAGSGVAGLKDTAVALAARFNGLAGIAIDQNGNLFVSDAGNSRVRKIVTTGYTISPALPTGLRFDSTTGIISGTLPTLLVPATYTVTAYNTGGSNSVVFVLAPRPVSLPIKLDNIRATNKGAVNEVQWNSVSEEAGDVYQVERSTDASNFITMGTLPGKAVNGGSYTYIDQAPVTGINYYRLKFLNIDGSNGYSKIVSATIKTAFGVTLFPNPVKSEITIQINGAINGTANVTIYDLAGKQYSSVRMSGTQATVPMNELPAGVYLVRYQDDQHNELFRVVKE